MLPIIGVGYFKLEVLDTLSYRHWILEMLCLGMFQGLQLEVSKPWILQVVCLEKLQVMCLGYFNL